MTKPKQEVLHRKTFMGGRMTPEEVHAKLGIRKKCIGCGAMATFRVRMYATADDFMKHMPREAAVIAAGNPLGPFIPTVPMTYGNMVLISDVGACPNCKATLQKEAAKHPDWMFPEFDDAARFKDNLLTQVT